MGCVVWGLEHIAGLETRIGDGGRLALWILLASVIYTLGLLAFNIVNRDDLKALRERR